ncbi:PQQ-dependent sugar dehydrogenase [Saccharopolyspora sp. HNM0983]|uniref:PQQ-dependent sugar dehydrogenase n=1 Tax=Saccharopolyspora montiporae TaxID=2781240 RepID=A0A929BD82_9PSEU|nr:PQQ-dependent sugar dehydrogenase [Saccharopolyspora sp. HNM0983]MBE9376225.1 PQQ-dependent sugar dehydrogenase [Saccharopolyspora sp. HNM0983]
MVATALGIALLAGCAQFPDEHRGNWSEQPSLEPQAGPKPSIEGEEPPPESSGPRPEAAEADGCTDPDPAVVATCLGPIGAVAVLPDGQGALVAERDTGRVLRVELGAEPVELARIPVDAVGDGGLTGLALSPSYDEDELFYAYATTGGENQVVRVAPGDSPKPVLTGIPRGSSGNSGALLDDGRGALLVATGDGGDPQAAANPDSPAGKVLRLDGFGDPAPDNPDPGSPVVATGLAEPSGLCGAPDDGGVWVTDRGGAQDSLYRVDYGRELGSPDWTWREKPGVSGCAAASGSVVVSLEDAAALFTLRPAPDGTFTGQPEKVLEGTYGRLSASARSPEGLVWLGTSNKTGGQPVPSDDRVVRIEPPSGGSAGKD